jgi:hypothetical protein
MNQAEALSELYPFTMTAMSDARMLFAKHCSIERDVKLMQMRLFATSENLGSMQLRSGVSVKDTADKIKKKKREGGANDEDSTHSYGLWGFKGPTGTSTIFDDETKLWELQCVRQHEQKVQRANQGYIDKNYLSDSGSKRARGLHIIEHRKTMVCPLCVSLVSIFKITFLIFGFFQRSKIKSKR